MILTLNKEEVLVLFFPVILVFAILGGAIIFLQTYINLPKLIEKRRKLKLSFENAFRTMLILIILVILFIVFFYLFKI